MAARLEIYKCEKCGNIVEVLHGGVGKLECCDEPMVLMEEKTADEGKEKHVPVTERSDHGTLVKVGDVPHPMEEKHYIEWIEVISGGNAYREFLEPGQAPEATFCLGDSEIEAVREYCSIHGLWKS